MRTNKEILKEYSRRNIGASIEERMLTLLELILEVLLDVRSLDHMRKQE